MKAKNPLKKNEIAYAFGPAQYAYDTNDQILGKIDIVMKFENMDFVPKIISGEFRGLSTGCIVRKWECSICNGDLEDCPHEVGKMYNDSICQMIATNIEYNDMSIVNVPKDQRCRIIDLLIVRKGKHPEYVWHGFQTNNEIERFKNIQDAQKRGLIPQIVALYFAGFFSITLEGKAVFS